MLTDPLAISFVGLALGARHAIDIDHLVAVATMIATERAPSRAAGVGALWGLGHTCTVGAAGGSILILARGPSAMLTAAAETAVAALLILLGGRALVMSRRTVASRPATLSFATGLVHGLSGTAVLTVLLLPTTGEPLKGVLFLLAFGAGTIITMSTMSWALAVPALGLRLKPWVLDQAGVIAGLSSVALGFCLLA